MFTKTLETSGVGVYLPPITEPLPTPARVTKTSRIACTQLVSLRERQAFPFMRP